MIPDYDIEYSLVRAAQERAAAAATDDACAKEAHRQMADRYADRALGDRERRFEAELRC